MADMQYIIHTPAAMPDTISAGSVLQAICDISYDSITARVRKMAGVCIGDRLSIRDRHYTAISIEPDGRSHIKILADATE